MWNGTATFRRCDAGCDRRPEATHYSTAFSTPSTRGAAEPRTITATSLPARGSDIRTHRMWIQDNVSAGTSGVVAGRIPESRRPQQRPERIVEVSAPVPV